MRAVLQGGSRRLQRQAPINPSKEGGFPGQQCHAPRTHPRGRAWSWAAGATQRGCRARPGLCSPAGPAHPAPGGCGRAQINPCSVPSQHPKQGEQSCCQAASPGIQGGSHATHHRQGNSHHGPLGCQMLLQAPDTLPASGHGQPQVLCQGREDALRAAQCHAVQHHSPAPGQLVLREWECYTRPAAPQAPTAAPQPWPWHTPCSQAEHGSDRLFSRSRGLQTRRGCRDGAPGRAPAGTAGGSPSPAPCPGAGRARPHAAPAWPAGNRYLHREQEGSGRDVALLGPHPN